MPQKRDPGKSPTTPRHRFGMYTFCLNRAVYAKSLNKSSDFRKSLKKRSSGVHIWLKPTGLSQMCAHWEPPLSWYTKAVMPAKSRKRRKRIQYTKAVISGVQKTDEFWRVHPRRIQYTKAAIGLQKGWNRLYMYSSMFLAIFGGLGLNR